MMELRTILVRERIRNLMAEAAAERLAHGQSEQPAERQASVGDRVAAFARPATIATASTTGAALQGSVRQGTRGSDDPCRPAGSQRLSCAEQR